MTTYALIDLANNFWRSRHVASKSHDTWEKIGMAMHLTLSSVNQMVRKFGIDHVVFCLEGKSWRKSFYKPYKANRALDVKNMTQSQIEEDKMFWETYEQFVNFLREKTNASVIRCENAEADDVIARFINLHPNDTHFIISSDTDFNQLISENVHQYNGVAGQLIKLDGYYDDRDRPVKDTKTKEHKLLEDPEYILFKKCIRGDATDNVFSAYPGVREKGTKNSVGIKEAFEDRNKQGFRWNNLMLQKWTDHNGVEHRVRDDYERNRTLIDLTAQPDEIKDAVDAAIRSSLRLTATPQVGIQLMRFGSKYELNKIIEQIDSYAKWLNAPYNGHLKPASSL